MYVNFSCFQDLRREERRWRRIGELGIIISMLSQVPQKRSKPSSSSRNCRTLKHAICVHGLPESQAPCNAHEEAAVWDLQAAAKHGGQLELVVPSAEAVAASQQLAVGAAPAQDSCSDLPGLRRLFGMEHYVPEGQLHLRWTWSPEAPMGWPAPQMHLSTVRNVPQPHLWAHHALAKIVCEIWSCAVQRECKPCKPYTDHAMASDQPQMDCQS